MSIALSMRAFIANLFASSIAYIIFKRFEPESIINIVLLLVVIPGSLVATSQWPFPPSLGVVLTHFIVYWSLILLFTVLYRTSPLHPLARYPGPFICRISKLWLVYVVVSGGKAHIYVQSLHKKYDSDIVRIGPNELSIIHRDFADTVLSVKGLPRGPYYESRMHEAGMSLDGLRDQAVHAIRRRPWARAMNSSNMKYYEELVCEVVDEFMAALSQRLGDVVDFSEWATFFGFDFIGKMAFTYDYGMIKNGRDEHDLIPLLRNTAIAGAWISHIPWIIPWLQYIPGASHTVNHIKALGEQTVKSRASAGSRRKDLLYHLMDEEGHEPIRPTLAICAVDGLLAIFAGSDTAATTLSHFWYFMLRQPTCFDRLREEVDEAFPHGTGPSSDLTKQATMPYLNACINETLRLYPPVLGGLQRRVEKGTGGRMLGSHLIPEDTQVSIYAYALHRDPRYFSPLPDTFWPDRWLPQSTYTVPERGPISQDKVVTTRDVFMPFSQGPMVCAGKNVALMEIRAVICAIAQQFHVESAKQASYNSYENELYEAFTTLRGSLHVRLQARKV